MAPPRAHVQMSDRISALSNSGFNTYVTDAQRGFTVVIVAGPIAALVLCLLYMLALRFFAGIVAWTVVIGINLLFVAITLLAAYKSGLLGSVGALSSLNDIMTSSGSTLDGAASMQFRKHASISMQSVVWELSVCGPLAPQSAGAGMSRWLAGPLAAVVG